MSTVIDKIKGFFGRLLKDVDATNPPRYYYKFESNGDISKVVDDVPVGSFKEEKVDTDALIKEWFEPDLNKKKKSELLQLCKQRGIKAAANLNKAQIIKLLNR